ncbi:Humj1 family protein [Hibiscus syriacus]|uniref:Humj1 family protein n=1 Tax=Hibiscus syriacus TaxID=106335 RepID=A0A6A3CLP1_HIBSY|nr:Humj1 family protein [Hibiscus syriacus]
MSKTEEPVVGVPYYAGPRVDGYQEGRIPPNAIYGDPKGIPIQQTMYRDTPAPFNCPYCGNSGLTLVRSKPSLAAVIASFEKSDACAVVDMPQWWQKSFALPA